MNKSANKSANKSGHKVAVLVPCLNEEVAIQKVVLDFKTVLPNAYIYVYDNGSTDQTFSKALDAGAIVKSHQIRGKGNVVRRMFADIQADIYVLVDGDGTYDSKTAPLMIEALIQQQLDMVSAVRELKPEAKAAYRPGHQWGNRLFTRMINLLFNQKSSKGMGDLLSGYRVFSRRFVKSFPIASHGFEIETELSIHAMQLDMPVLEILSPYDERPEGSVSKLSTYKDGFKILKMVFRLLEQEKPFLFFGWIAAVLFMLGFIAAIPVIETYWQTGLVPRIPTAILSTGLILLSFLSFFSGLILHSVAMSRKEAKQLAYLRYEF
jgi:glycosyltransferase involved in cell wall biosynthesis